ncbi:DUF418 domain-containing protein [Bacillus kandeliae]|uniref:DUF418 domain-containing protein n=1 Tax=Bacillus kandeliae TaxID=3129297 RepID=A0ABZ2NCL3_9BACI
MDNSSIFIKREIDFPCFRVEIFQHSVLKNTTRTLYGGTPLSFSCIWLKYFRFGPLEWLWRCGTYLKLYPLLKNNHDS